MKLPKKQIHASHEEQMIANSMQYVVKSSKLIVATGIAAAFIAVMDLLLNGPEPAAILKLAELISPIWQGPNDIITKYRGTKHFHAASVSTSIYIACFVTLLARTVFMISEIPKIPRTDLRILWYFRTTGKDKLVSTVNLAAIILFTWGFSIFVFSPLALDKSNDYFRPWTGSLLTMVMAYALNWIIGWVFIVAVSGTKNFMHDRCKGHQ